MKPPLESPSLGRQARRSAPRDRHPARATQGGSSLIEVLVALLLSAIGMLGLAGAIASSVAFTKMADHRSTAVVFAEDIAGRMRANAGAAYAGDYDRIGPFAPGTDTSDVPACLHAEACTPAEQALRDLDDWSQALRRSVPSGAGYVRFDEATAIADVWVGWLDPISGLQPARPAGECPDAFAPADPSPRCLHLRVAL